MYYKIASFTKILENAGFKGVDELKNPDIGMAYYSQFYYVRQDAFEAGQREMYKRISEECLLKGVCINPIFITEYIRGK